MRKQLVILVTLLMAIMLLCGCSKTVTGSKYGNYVQSYAKYQPDIKGKQLGMLPFACKVSFIGEAIGQNTAGNLVDTGFILVDGFEISQRLKKENVVFFNVVKNKEYDKILQMTGVDYLLVGNVEIYSPRRKRIISATAHILDAKGDVVVKVRFEPPSGRWKMTAIGQVLAMEIKRVLGVGR
jgi:curli biogenesis system outer membrane secretion channel CsgG